MIGLNQPIRQVSLCVMLVPTLSLQEAEPLIKVTVYRWLDRTEPWDKPRESCISLSFIRTYPLLATC